jgi:hypothetical protein
MKSHTRQITTTQNYKKGQGMMLIERLTEELKKNNGKIPKSFVESILNHKDTKVSHAKLTPNTRVCVITTVYGHDLVGYAQVLDASNDVELTGQSIAYKNAADQLWSVLGSVAKILQ